LFCFGSKWKIHWKERNPNNKEHGGQTLGFLSSSGCLMICLLLILLIVLPSHLSRWPKRDLQIETFIMKEAPKIQFIFLLFFLVCWANSNGL
jgi:hypothetical protein